MKIAIAGNDPAALYAGILIRKARPDWHVALIDSAGYHARPAHILSNPVKPEFHLRDGEIAAAIEKHSLKTVGLNVRRTLSGPAEEKLICGLPYRTISDTTLRQILQQTARAAGCTGTSGTIAQNAEYGDLLIVGDPDLLADAGEQASGLRAQPAFTSQFSAHFRLGRAAESIAFDFIEAEHGVVHAMLIPSTPVSSSLIVFADGATLERAGQSHADADSVRNYCTRLFAATIRDASLELRSQAWVQDETYLAPKWHQGKIALIGAAASRPHESVGLAVRTGFEDAEALVDELLHAGTIEDALASWQTKRLPKAQSLHRAANASAEWLNHARQHFAMPMPRFAFSCATRSLRLNYTHVKKADPAFIREVDAIVAGPAVGTGNEPPPPMFTPYAMRGLTIPNRLIFSPMCMYSAHEGTVNDFQLVHLGSRAVGGFGLVFAEMTNVRPEGRMTYQCAGMYSPEHVGAFRRITDFVHANTQAKIGIQLAHAGRKGSISRSWERDKPLTKDEEWETLAPSAIAFTPDRPLPREMSVKDIRDVTDAFARAARMSEEAGFDMIEIHAAHGYLLSSFISPLSNKRTDAYGGSLENRMRFPLEVLEAVRANFPQEKPISVRISASDWRPDGVQPRDAIEISKMLQARGADIVAVSSSGVTAERRPAVVERLYQLAFSDAIRNEGGVPTMTVGGVLSHGDCNTIIASGRADICLMARGALNDPYFPQHAAKQQGYRMKWPDPYARAAETPVRAG